MVERFNVNDKVLHAAGFGILAVLLWRAMDRKRLGWLKAAIVVAWATVYGYTDEFHQRFVPGRDFDMNDLVADGVGSAVVAAYAAGRERLSRGSKL